VVLNKLLVRLEQGKNLTANLTRNVCWKLLALCTACSLSQSADWMADNLWLLNSRMLQRAVHRKNDLFFYRFLSAAAADSFPNFCPVYLSFSGAENVWFVKLLQSIRYTTLPGTGKNLFSCWNKIASMFFFNFLQATMFYVECHCLAKSACTWD